MEKTSKNYRKVLETMAKIVEETDEQTGGHCERVAYNSYLIGQKIGLSKDKLNLLYWAGLLHDLGKIGVSKEILLKAGRLTDKEYKKIKKHTVFGYELLNFMTMDFKPIAKGVKHHHE